MAAAMETNSAECEPDMWAQLIVRSEPSNELIVGDIDPGLESEIGGRSNEHSEEKPDLKFYSDEKPIVPFDSDEKPIVVFDSDEKPIVPFDEEEKESQVIPFDIEEKKPLVKLEESAGEGTSVLWNLVKDMDIVKKEEEWDVCDIGGDIISPEDILEDDDIKPVIHLTKQESADPDTEIKRTLLRQEDLSNSLPMTLKNPAKADNITTLAKEVKRFLSRKRKMARGEKLARDKQKGRLNTTQMNDKHLDQKNPCSCVMCDKTSQAKITPNTCPANIQLTLNTASLACNVCSRVYKSKRALKRHCRAHDVSNGRKLLDEDKEKDVGGNLCEQLSDTDCIPKTKCPLVSHVNRGFEIDHLREHGFTDDIKTTNTNEKNFECKKCGDFFKSTYYLTRHLESDHIELCESKNEVDLSDLFRNNLPKERTRNFVCVICDDIFKRKKERDDHCKIIHGINKETRYCCNQCGRTCQSVAQLKRHQLSHSDEKKFICDHCGNSYKTEKSLRYHLQMIRERHVCDECGKGFSTKEYLINHKESIHSRRNRFYCEICGKIFYTQKNIASHIKIVHSKHLNKPVCCNVCCKEFADKRLMQKHKIRNHMSLKFTCNDCLAVFKYKQCLRRHIQFRHLPPTFECIKCSKMLPSYQYLQNHLRSTHAVLATSALKNGETTKNNRNFICAVCDEIFPSRNQRDYHEESIHGANKENRWQCKQCDRICRCIADFKRHLLSHSDQKNFTCDHCQNRYKTKKSLERHLKMICKTHVCHECGKGFTTEQYLSEHKENIHSRKNNFHCEICRKIFYGKKEVTRHIKVVHSKHLSGSVSCDVCEKDFSNRKLMQRHRRYKHTSLEFTCNDCLAVFKTKQGLSIHIQAHHLPPTHKCDKCCQMLHSHQALQTHLRSAHSVDNRTDHLCPVCGKCFKLREALVNHQMIHSGEKPHVCDVCGKSFRTYTNLYQHAHTHSDVRRFKCGVCDKEFRIKHHLRQHMATHGMASVPQYGKRGRKLMITNND